ncbi:MAG TPA: hypothetical protein VFJ57_06975 [Solirubrobacterales bacterium]|nr:hypothetical protein [Solirubrobacterales bacterium]
MESDRVRAIENQSRPQLEITELLQTRAHEIGALAFALTGSTARAQRTKISDLDYHVIGPRPPHSDLPDDVDVYATDEVGMWRKLNQGDDFIQWTLRYGCVLFDTGVFQAAMQRMSNAGLWPTSDQKFSRLDGHIRLARRLIAMGDRDAAQDQVRATLTSLARALLLQARVFPRARFELPLQLHEIGAGELGSTLLETICEEPELNALGRALDLAASLVPEKPADSPLRSAG